MSGIIGLDGRPAQVQPDPKLKMPWITTLAITAVVQANSEPEAKAGLQRLIQVSLALYPHIMELVMDAQPMPPELLAEMLAKQKGLKDG